MLKNFGPNFLPWAIPHTSSDNVLKAHCGKFPKVMLNHHCLTFLSPIDTTQSLVESHEVHEVVHGSLQQRSHMKSDSLSHQDSERYEKVSLYCIYYSFYSSYCTHTERTHTDTNTHTHIHTHIRKHTHTQSTYIHI